MTPPAKPADELAPRSGRARFAAGAAVLVVAVLVAYLPALRGSAIWDDDYMVTNNACLRSAHGLWKILFDPTAMPVYYPVTSAVLWAEAQVFGTADLTGFHVVNVLLHGVNGVLLWRLLRRLAVPGAFAAATIWALHPVAAETVAWVTEHKNTLSTLFYLAAMSALSRYLIGGTRRRGWWYGAALVAFGLSLGAKTVTATFPAAALVVVWWKLGRVRAGHVWAMVPFVALGAAAGAVTQYVETHVTGAWQDEWSLTRPQQILVAGRALWFYAAKLAWPAGLSFAYPRWRVDAGVAWQWAFPLAAAAVVAGLWLARRRLGRGPAAGVLLFAGTLVPALGFFHVLFQRYSLVADHFQYLASAALIATATAGVARLRAPPAARAAALAVVAGTLGVMTFRSSHRFASDVTAWGSALAADRDSPIVNFNYGSALVMAERYDEAAGPLRRAMADPSLLPHIALAFGMIADRRRDYPAALEAYRQSVQLEPRSAESRYYYGRVLLIVGRFAEAEAQLRTAVDQSPRQAATHDTLGVCLLHLGRPREALAEFEQARSLDPALPLVDKHLGDARAALQR